MENSFKGKEANRVIRALNEENQSARWASKDAFQAAIVKKLRKFCDKGETFWYSFDVNLANKDYCRFLDFIGMQTGAFDLTYEAMDFETYTTTEKEVVKTGYSGTIDASGNISLSANYATIETKVDNVNVYGKEQKKTGVVMSIAYFKEKDIKLVEKEWNELHEQYPLYRREGIQHKKVRRQKSKAKINVMIQWFAIIVSLFLGVFSIVNGVFNNENKYPIILFPVIGIAAALYILYWIFYNKLDKEHKGYVDQGMPLFYAILPLVALALLTLGNIMFPQRTVDEVGFGIDSLFAIVGTLGTIVLTLYHFIDYTFLGNASMYVYNFEKDDPIFDSYVKHGRAEGYEKRIKAIRDKILDKRVTRFSTDFFSNANVSSLEKEQAENFYKFGHH